MRAVIQRVSGASVKVDGKSVAHIGPGMLVLVAVSVWDSSDDVRWMAEKICGIRIFPDPDGRMNLDINQAGGQILLVSQFTLYGDCKKGKRPSYTDSAKSPDAERLYMELFNEISGRGIEAQHGVFGAMMQVELTNDGPVTLIVDSPHGRPNAP